MLVSILEMMAVVQANTRMHAYPASFSISKTSAVLNLVFWTLRAKSLSKFWGYLTFSNIAAILEKAAFWIRWMRIYIRRCSGGQVLLLCQLCCFEPQRYNFFNFPHYLLAPRGYTSGTPCVRTSSVYQTSGSHSPVFVSLSHLFSVSLTPSLSPSPNCIYHWSL